MDERRMEQLLRESWSPQPPDGMRERTLRRAWGAIPAGRPGALPVWRLVVAAMAIAWIGLVAVSDSSRQERFARMTGGGQQTLAGSMWSLADLQSAHSRLSTLCALNGDGPL